MRSRLWLLITIVYGLTAAGALADAPRSRRAPPPPARHTPPPSARPAPRPMPQPAPRLGPQSRVSPPPSAPAPAPPPPPPTPPGSGFTGLEFGIGFGSLDAAPMTEERRGVFSLGLQAGWQRPGGSLRPGLLLRPDFVFTAVEGDDKSLVTRFDLAPLASIALGHRHFVRLAAGPLGTYSGPDGFRGGALVDLSAGWRRVVNFYLEGRNTWGDGRSELSIALGLRVDFAILGKLRNMGPPAPAGGYGGGGGGGGEEEESGGEEEGGEEEAPEETPAETPSSSTPSSSETPKPAAESCKPDGTPGIYDSWKCCSHKTRWGQNAEGWICCSSGSNCS